jgi:hypothetical protein
VCRHHIGAAAELGFVAAQHMCALPGEALWACLLATHASETLACESSVTVALDCPQSACLCAEQCWGEIGSINLSFAIEHAC